MTSQEAAFLKAIVGAAGEMDMATTMAVVTTAGADDTWALKIMMHTVVPIAFETGCSVFSLVEV